jgi:hypothetical protein
MKISAVPNPKEMLARNKALEAELTHVKRQLSDFASRHNRHHVVVPTQRDVIRYGVFGDTQYGSLYERAQHLQTFFDICHQEGVRDLLCTGDVLDGHGIYKGQQFEVHKQGWAQQRQHFAEVAPRRKGMRVRFITGNHDASFKKCAGISVGKDLEAVRPDWEFVGEDVGLVTFKTPSGRMWNVQLLHPSGGTAYALSYHMQKIIEALPGGSKPDMLCVGHYHKAELLPCYRNVCGLQSACFQGQTPFMKTKGLAAHVGGWIIEVAVGKGLNGIKAQFWAFYV